MKCQENPDDVQPFSFLNGSEAAYPSTPMRDSTGRKTPRFHVAEFALGLMVGAILVVVAVGGLTILLSSY